MNYRTLGKSKLQISEVSFGCMSLENDYPKAEKLLHNAIDRGVNYFDTADLYQKGENEKMVGKALKKYRNEVIIGTKVGNQWRADGSGWDWNPSKDYILNAVDKSLQRLQTDYIDLYQLHGGTIDDPIDETIEAFELLKQQGKIRHYGISSIRPNVIKEWIKRSDMTSVMMQYSLLDRRPEEECLDLLEENKIGVLSRGTLAKGILAGKPAKAYLDYTQHDILKIQNKIRAVIDGDTNLYDMALQFVLQHQAITSAVIGIRTEKHLEEMLRSANAHQIQQKEVNFVRTQIPAKHYEQHR